jgi:TolB-like protein
MTEEDKPPSSPSTGSGQGGLAAFWAELKRRKVMRVAITYAVVAWLIIQVANATFGSFGIPEWAYRFVVIMLCIFFPVAVILAWAFELTPDGIKTTKHAREEQGALPLSEGQQKKRNWVAYLAGALIPTLIFGALALFFYFQAKPTQEPLPSSISQLPSTDNDKSIAVLPLANMSPDPENAFFADGVHEDVLTNLSQIKELMVIGRTSTLQYRDTVKTLQQIGDELNVRYLVEGSVRRAGNQVRITVQLTDSETGGHLWAETYNRQLDDIFAIQAAIAKEIASELRAVISPVEIARIERRPTENLEAYEYYVKHRELDGGDQKIALLEKAVALDPDYAEAWAALVTEAIFWWDVGKNRSDPELRKKAHHALEMAKRTGPDLPHLRIAQHTMALREDHDLRKAIVYLHEALEIEPNFSLAHMRLGQRYYQLGRLTEVQYHLETALKTDPFERIANFYLHDLYVVRGEWSRARELNLKKIELGDDAGFFWRWNLITDEYLESGNKQNFLSAIETNEAFNEMPTVQLTQSLLLGDLGKALQRIQSLGSESRFSFFNFNSAIFSFGIEPLDLLSALITFEQEDRKQVAIEVQKAEIHIKEIIDKNPMAFPTYWSSLIICYALSGETDLIPATVDRVREQTRLEYWKYDYQLICEIQIAICYLILGDHDQALSTLEAASKLDGPIFLNRELDLWFIFDRLRGDPRFDKLLED